MMGASSVAERFCSENAVRDPMPAARATLQRVGQLLPLGIVSEQFRAFRDGLKNVVQIVNQTFQS